MKKIIIYTVFILLLLCTTVYAQEDNVDKSVSLHLKYDEKTSWYGYVDDNMNWVIKPQFSSCRQFSEGLAYVEQTDGNFHYHGYILTDGQHAFDKQFIEGSDFKNGKAVVKLFGTKDEECFICIIDAKGNIVKNLKVSYPINVYENTQTISRRMINYSMINYYFMEGDKNIYYYFTDNRELIDHPILKISNIYDDTVVFFSGLQGCEMGIFNKRNGKILTHFTDEDGGLYPFQKVEFSEGILKAEIIIENKSYYVFYNTRLEPITKQIFIKAKCFSEGVAVVGVKKNENYLDNTIKYGYLNKDGSWFIHPVFQDASSFQDGIAIVRKAFGIVLLNRNGTYRTHTNKIEYYKDTNMTKQEYDYVYSEADKIIDNIIKKSMSDLDKIKAINRYIIEHVEDDKNYSITKDQISRVSHTPFGAFKYGIAASEAYTKATKILLDKAGIQNKYISGDIMYEDGQLEGHIWNLVKLNGNYYHLDTRWNDIFKNKCYYFLVSDDYMKSLGFRQWDYSKYPKVPKGYFNDIIQVMR
jgi:hypothetical protein